MEIADCLSVIDNNGMKWKMFVKETPPPGTSTQLLITADDNLILYTRKTRWLMIAIPESKVSKRRISEKLRIAIKQNKELGLDRRRS